MKPIMVLLALSISGRAFAQDEMDQELQALAGKLVQEGTSAKLGELTKSPHGLQAIKEKIEYLVACRSGRFERDPQGYFEDYLFKTDSDGSLVLRADRRDLVDRMAEAVGRAPRMLQAFNRRLDALVAEIAETVEMDRRMKAALGDPEIRLALFHHLVGEVRESDLEELVYQALTRALTRNPDGKLRVGGPHAQELKDRVQAITAQLKLLKDYQSAYLNLVAKVENADQRSLAASEAALVFVLGRLTRESQEGVEARTGDLVEGDADNNVPKSITLNKDFAQLLGRVADFSKLVEDLKPLLEKTAKEIAPAGGDESLVLELLHNDRARYLLAERIQAWREAEAAKADATFKQIREDWFFAAGGRLGVKAGRFVDENKQDTPLAIANEFGNFVNEFQGSRSGLEQIAERLNNPSLAALFEKREATFAMNDQIQDVVQTLSGAVRREGLVIFEKLYLSPKGELYQVRPEREKRIEEMVGRAEAIRKEAEKAGQNP